MTPESHLTGDMASLVEVWGVLVAFVHVTVVPSLIVSVVGTNWNPLAMEPMILMLAWAPPGVMVEPALGVLVADGEAALDDAVAGAVG